jgi:polyisoprenoid-binding protein YceI
MNKILTLILYSSFSILSIAQGYTPVDEGSKVKFVIKNFGINTGGTFEGLSGTINFDPNDLVQANFTVSVDAKSVDTDVESRDNHLRREEYLFVEKYPKLVFQSTRVTKTNNSGYLYMFGTITIKGTTKEIQFPFKATPKEGGYLFEGSFKLNRRDFNVGGSSISMSDNLEVSLSVFAKKQ